MTVVVRTVVWFLSAGILLLASGCRSDEDPSPGPDCRNATLACATGFVCSADEAGRWDCVPASADVIGGDVVSDTSDVGDVPDEDSGSDVDAEGGADSSDSAPDAAEQDTADAAEDDAEAQDGSGSGSEDASVDASVNEDATDAEMDTDADMDTDAEVPAPTSCAHELSLFSGSYASEVGISVMQSDDTVVLTVAPGSLTVNSQTTTYPLDLLVGEGEVTLTDAYGDGWNGAYFTLRRVEPDTVIAEGTLQSGPLARVESFTVVCDSP